MARLTCQEMIALLADYLEAALGEEVLRALEDHLRDCAPCVAYLNTYRRTREVAAQANRVEMPEEMRQRLAQFLLTHLRPRTPGAPPE
jgi:hypothetical protein